MTITKITRSEIIDKILLAGKAFHGRLDLITFLDKIWDLSNLPSTDSRFNDAKGDIWQHMVRNDDWSYSELLSSRLNLIDSDDKTFKKFLETRLHPLVVNTAEEASELANDFNQHLKNDGYKLQVTSHISGKPIYSVVPIETNSNNNNDDTVYEIVLSFAGEDREYVEAVAKYLRTNDVSCFYDKYEDVTLWGKDLVEHLDVVYRSARYCVMFISEHYSKKIWPSHERRSALSRAIEQKGEYILPARFDNTELPGIRHTIGYVDLKNKKPDELAKMILKKLGRSN
jgi:hypothetical protein